MSAIAWIVIAPCLLLAFIVLAVVVRPDAAQAVASVLQAASEPLRILMPWWHHNSTEPQRTQDEAQQ